MKLQVNLLSAYKSIAKRYNRPRDAIGSLDIISFHRERKFIWPREAITIVLYLVLFWCEAYIMSGVGLCVIAPLTYFSFRGGQELITPVRKTILKNSSC